MASTLERAAPEGRWPKFQRSLGTNSIGGAGCHGNVLGVGVGIANRFGTRGVGGVGIVGGSVGGGSRLGIGRKVGSGSGHFIDDTASSTVDICAGASPPLGSSLLADAQPARRESASADAAFSDLPLRMWKTSATRCAPWVPVEQSRGRRWRPRRCQVGVA
jgi:hypothetical protein